MGGYQTPRPAEGPVRDLAPEQAAERFEHAVAGRVAIGVVHRLEAIDIDQPEHFPILPFARIVIAPVAEIRQWVMARLTRQVAAHGQCRIALAAQCIDAPPHRRYQRRRDRFRVNLTKAAGL